MIEEIYKIYILYSIQLSLHKGGSQHFRMCDYLQKGTSMFSKCQTIACQGFSD